MMAVVKASYTRSRPAAKANVRYIAHRPGQDGTPLTRDLWDADGRLSRQEAYERIDTAPKGSIFFRLSISPDPQSEDTRRDLHLRAVTEATMQTLEERTQTPLVWLATTHADHAPHRHVHVLAITRGRLAREDLTALTRAASTASQQQRQERDALLQAQAAQQVQEEVGWEER